VAGARLQDDDDDDNVILKKGRVVMLRTRHKKDVRGGFGGTPEIVES